MKKLSRQTAPAIFVRLDGGARMQTQFARSS